MSDGEQERIAYCAPGWKAAAELVLVLRGEHVSEVTEHPWLEGTTDVYVFTPQPFSAGMPPFRMQSRFPAFPEITRPGFANLITGL